ncbi:MAG: ferrous iron transport protein B [Bdellovibrionaceae bacterium]|nr:ferrous iron transport protein B [Pseudobdellovibrionaceae bacterium]
MKINVAIAGNPNSGKTTLFNSLAGTNYHVANYAGVTVEKKSASVKYNSAIISFVDLPGTYSLTPYSLEEKVARNYIIDEKPDIIVQVVDASNLERNLYLTMQLLELDVPIIIALNMVDVAEKREITIDDVALSKKMGVSVVKTIARTSQGKEELLKVIENFDSTKKALGIQDFSYGEDIDSLLIKTIRLIEQNEFLTKYSSPKWVALKYIENDEQILKEGNLESKKVHTQLLSFTTKIEKHTETTFSTYPEAIISDHRYGIVSSLLKNTVKRKSANLDRVFMSDRIDIVLTQRLIGPIVLLGILYFSYQFTFWASEYPVAWLESFFEIITTLANNNLPDGLLKSLVVDGIVGGVGGVLGFTPLIMFMFFIIAVLEDSGYMARVAYMLDRLFRFFGLQGNSVLPYIVSGGIAGGCAVPGVMATRTIKSQKERLLTILTAPFMACGAKLPVFALLITAFFPGDKSLLLLGITVLSWLSALIVAKVLGSTVVKVGKSEASSFIMELPPYRFPTLKGLFIHAWERTWMYIRKAGTIILSLSIVLWVLMTFPQMSETELKIFEDKKDNVSSQYTPEVVQEIMTESESLSAKAKELQEKLTKIGNTEAQEALKYSIAGRVGTFIEPITKYAGFDWRTNIALIGGIAAKEVVVSTLGIAYSLGDVDTEDTGSLSEKLANDPQWDFGVALALIFFTILYAPCFVTVVMISKESGSWKWGGFTVVSYTALAFFVSVIVNNIF